MTNITNENHHNEDQTVILHWASCNDHKTHDGIQNGGERLVDEMLQVIRSHTKKLCCINCKYNVTNITISILGTSLGGMYARYAIAKLHKILLDRKHLDKSENKKKMVLDDTNIPVHFNVFHSVITPHLGLAGTSYFNFPRWVQKWIAKKFLGSGDDM